MNPNTYFEQKKFILALTTLFKESYDRNIDAKYFEWRYFDKTNPPPYFECEIRDKILASSYSAMPMEIAHNGEIFESIQSMTTMTHPNWRGLGLFVALAKALYSRGILDEKCFVWGFPNTKSQDAFVNKLGWSEICQLPTLTFDLDRPRHMTHKDVSVLSRDDGFQFEYPGMPNDGLIRVNRSREYLFWRYARNPTNNYSNFVIHRQSVVSSYLVTKTFKDGIDLVDFHAVNSNEARLLLMGVIQIGLESGIKTLNCWCTPGANRYNVLRDFGFTESEPFTYFSGLELIPGSAPLGWLDIHNWDIQMGDSDVY